MVIYLHIKSKVVINLENAIKEYLPLKDNIKQEIWEKGTFVFDTNVLLNLYRYTKEARETLIATMEKYKTRVWIPYHVAYEFMDMRCEAIYQKTKNNEALTSEKNTFVKNIRSKLRLDNNDETLKELDKYLADWIERQVAANQIQIDYNDDSILDFLLTIFKENTGNAFNEEEQEKLEKEGEKRYRNKIPPGYKDDKKDKNRYGDFFIWKQMMDYAKEHEKDIIFVTDDKKEDWQYILHGETIGIRPELLREFYNKTKRNFIMYSTWQFIEYFSDNKNANNKESILDEMRNTHEKYIDNTNLKQILYLGRKDFIGEDLRNADLICADLSGVLFTGADLRNADLMSADLSSADLRGANLKNVNLNGADLSSAILEYAILEYATLRYVNLNGASLRRADLSDADLSGADLNNAYLRGTCFNKTIMNKKTYNMCNFDGAIMVESIIIK